MCKLHVLVMYWAVSSRSL